MFHKLQIIVFALAFALSSHLAEATYAKAQSYFKVKDYYQAAPAFFQAYSYPKNAAEKAKAEWGLAQSLQNIGFGYSASKYYSLIVRRGSKSSNPFFRKAMEELGKINDSINLGQSHIVQLFKSKIKRSAIPGPARGFYFHYKGIEAFGRERFKEAQKNFSRVSSGSEYYLKAQFHLGVIATIRGRKGEAVNYFQKVKSRAPNTGNGQWLQEQANLNIARVYYESKKFRDSIRYYAQIPRESDNWLQALFESAWGFFLMQNHNNALGNIHTLHSPFFINRFFPESFILQAITFLRLCRYSQVKGSLKLFRKRYARVLSDVKKILNRYRGNSSQFFRQVYDYRKGNLRKYRGAWSVMDALSRSDAYREANNTIRFADRELARMRDTPKRWMSSGLRNELKQFLTKKKDLARVDAGSRLYKQGLGYRKYLEELSNQTKLINAEMLLGKVDELRAKLNLGTAKKKGQFIGGMRELRLGEDLEFWPFEGEYWEDELGGYVYNIDSQCKKKKRGK